ncbi:hypothetical protein V1264_007815 [Littorina saxatilis]|uniref:Chitin-binding type-2 domain-containing protein n=1 Tax=Littorina saxatilis TaxID=31220 RepID=A0AAN9AVN8_9CAEN
MDFMSVLVVLSAALIAIISAQNNLCPANVVGDIADGNSCVTFIRCQNGRAQRFNCPRQFPFFDANNRRCSNQRTINCVQNNNFVAPLVPGQGWGLGQAQQPGGVNQVQIAGANGVQPGILGQPNLSAPVLPSNPPGGLFPRRGGGLGGVPLVGAGAGAGALANGNANTGAQVGGNALGGGGGGFGQGGRGQAGWGRAGWGQGGQGGWGQAGQAGQGGWAQGGQGGWGQRGFGQGGFGQGGLGQGFGGANVGAQAGNGAGWGQAGQGVAGQGFPGQVNNNPLGVPGRQGVLAPPQPGNQQGPGFLNNPQGQDGGNVNGGDGVNGTGQGQGQGQGLLAGVPFVNVNQRQSATVNQNQSVGVNPGKK